MLETSFGTYRQYAERLNNAINFLTESDTGNGYYLMYRFDILKAIGYLFLYGYGIKNDCKTTAQTFFNKKIFYNDKYAVPVLFSFDNLLEKIKKQYFFTLDTVQESYGERKNFQINLKFNGLDLLFAGIDIIAIKKGYMLLLSNTKTSAGWQENWQNFCQKSDDFLQKLYKLDGKLPFVTDKVREELARYKFFSNESFSFILRQLK